MSKFLSVVKFTSALSGGLLAGYALYCKVGELNEAAKDMDQDFGISEGVTTFVNGLRFTTEAPKLREVSNA